MLCSVWVNEIWPILLVDVYNFIASSIPFPTINIKKLKPSNSRRNAPFSILHLTHFLHKSHHGKFTLSHFHSLFPSTYNLVQISHPDYPLNKAEPEPTKYATSNALQISDTRSSEPITIVIEHTHTQWKTHV